MRGYQRCCLLLLCAIAFSACLLPDAAWQAETGELQSRGSAGASGAALSWDAAVQSCLSRGARLATVETVARDQFITSLIDSEVWIGASDAALDGQFAWNDGSPLTFSGWGPGEPNGGPGVDCVLKTVAGGWNDRRCTDLAALVCVLQL